MSQSHMQCFAVGHKWCKIARKTCKNEYHGKILQKYQLPFLGVGVGGCLLLKTHHRCTYEDKRSLHSHRSTIYNRISSLHSGSLTQSLLNP